MHTFYFKVYLYECDSASWGFASTLADLSYEIGTTSITLQPDISKVVCGSVTTAYTIVENFGWDISWISDDFD